MLTPSKLGTAVITGGSNGIGAVYADRLARRGYDLVLIARSANRLEAVAERIRSDTGVSVSTLSADLSIKSDVARVEALLADDPSITLLINNAGIGAVTPLVDSDISKMEQLIDVNVTALTRLTYAIVPKFIARRKGTLINIASVVGVSPETLNGVYGASKAFVIAFTQSLHHELSSAGVRVQAVLPGATATDFWAISGLPHENLPQEILMPVEPMVDAALAGLDAGELITIPALQDGEEWERYDSLRQAMATRLSTNRPAPRYAPAN